MKIQDASFIIILTVLLLIRRKRALAIVGVFFILSSLPLFYFKIALFTAERLIIYAAGLFLLRAVLYLVEIRKLGN